MPKKKLFWAYPCEKKGVCCDCIEYHKSWNELPACFFPKDAEATYDRSIKKFIEIWKNRI